MLYSEPSGCAHGLGTQILTVLSDMLHHGRRYMDFFFLIVIEQKKVLKINAFTRCIGGDTKKVVYSKVKVVCVWGEFLLTI